MTTPRGKANPPAKHDDTSITIEYDVVELQLGRDPVIVKCPYCKSSGHTVLMPKVGLVTFIWAVGICFMGGVLGCCLIPFFRECSLDIGHYCAQCKKYIGRYDKIRKKAVR